MRNSFVPWFIHGTALLVTVLRERSRSELNWTCEETCWMTTAMLLHPVTIVSQTIWLGCWESKIGSQKNRFRECCLQSGFMNCWSTWGTSWCIIWLPNSNVVLAWAQIWLQSCFSHKTAQINGDSGSQTQHMSFVKHGSSPPPKRAGKVAWLQSLSVSLLLYEWVSVLSQKKE